MKRIIFSLLVLSLTACSSLETEQPPTAFHSRDLSDSDADGVINARDLCADTPKHAVIDNNGCPIVKYSEEENKLHILLLMILMLFLLHTMLTLKDECFSR